MVVFLPIIVLTILLNRWKPFLEFKVQSSKFKVKTPLCVAASPCRLVFLFIFVRAHRFSSVCAPKADGRLHIDFLDVGQGDSALVNFSER